MLMEPGESHVTRRIFAPGGTFRVLLISPGTFRSLTAGLCGRRWPAHLGVGSSSRPDLFAIFARFHTAVESGATGLEQQARLSACVQQLVRYCSEGPVDKADAIAPTAVVRGRDFIMDSYNQDISLHDLAAAAGVSSSHLCRAFSARFGLPPHAYQLQVRVARARAMLAHGRAPAEVAHRTGFCDQSHLTRHFPAVLGVTPGQYAPDPVLAAAQ